MLLDAWLLRKFPGKMLEELDGMDIARYFRALEAESIELLETRRSLMIAGKLEQSDLSPSDWEQITEHDRLVSGGQ